MRTGQRCAARGCCHKCAATSVLPQVCWQTHAVKRHAGLRGLRPVALLRPCANRAAPAACANGHVLGGPMLMRCPMLRCCARSGGLLAACPHCCRPALCPQRAPRRPCPCRLPPGTTQDCATFFRVWPCLATVAAASGPCSVPAVTHCPTTSRKPGFFYGCPSFSSLL